MAESTAAPASGGATRSLKVGTMGLAFTGMVKGWELLHDLMGGTRQMRARRDKWLPQEEGEPAKAYESRLSRSILYEALRNTIDRLSDRPFAKDVQLKLGDDEAATLPDLLEPIERDADYQNTSLTQFARDRFADAALHGLTHFLVEYPGTAPGSRVEEAESGKHPYFAPICPANLWWWKLEKDRNGRLRPVELHIRETRAEIDADGREVEVVYVRVIQRTDAGVTWSLFRKADKGDEYTGTGDGGDYGKLTEIPLVTCYFKQTGPLTADPPLEGLGWLNVAHWQSDSDQRNILKVARIPILYETGVSSEDKEKATVVSSRRVTKRTNKDARMVYVEPQGAAIGHGRQDVLDLEARMVILGHEPYAMQQVAETATGKAIDEERSVSSMEAWIRAMESALRRGYEVAATMVGAELPEGFEVDIQFEARLFARAATDLQNLLAMRQAGEIDRLTFLREVRRREVLAGDTDLEAVIEAVKAEGPSLAELTAGLPGAPADDDEEDEGDEQPEAGKSGNLSGANVRELAPVGGR